MVFKCIFSCLLEFICEYQCKWVLGRICLLAGHEPTLSLTLLLGISLTADVFILLMNLDAINSFIATILCCTNNVGIICHCCRVLVVIVAVVCILFLRSDLLSVMLIVYFEVCCTVYCHHIINNDDILLSGNNNSSMISHSAAIDICRVYNTALTSAKNFPHCQRQNCYLLLTESTF